MNKVVKWLLILLAVPIAFAVLVPMLVPKERVLDLAADAVREQAGLELSVTGDASFSVFPRLGLQLAEVSLSNPEQDVPLLHARRLAISLQLLPLFAGDAEVGGVELDGVDVTIEAKEDNAPATAPRSDSQLDDYYRLRRTEREAARLAVGKAAAVAAAPIVVNVEQVSLTDSRFVLEQVDAEPLIVVVDALTLSGVNLSGAPIALAGSVAVQPPAGAEQVKLNLSGELAFDMGAGQLAIPELAVTVIHPDYESAEIQVDGTVDTNTLDAALVLTLSYDTMRLDGTVKYASYGSPQVNAELRVNQLEPVLLLAAAPAVAEPSSTPEVGGTDTDLSQPLPLDALRDIDARLRVELAATEFQGHDLQDLLLVVRAVDGQINLRKLEGQVHGGKFEVNASFNGRHNEASLNSTGKISGLDVGSLQRALDVDSPVDGSANLEWKVLSTGATPQALLDAMVADLELGLQGSDLKGGGTVRYQGSGSPQIDAKLLLNRLDPALFALAGPDAAEQASEEIAEPDSGSEDLPLELIRQIDTRAELGIGKAIFGNHIIDNLQMTLRAAEGEVRISKMKGKVHGGELDVRAVLDARGDTAKISARGGILDVDIAALLKAMDTEPLARGTASLNWKIMARGNNPESITATLNGPVTVRTQRVTVPDFALEESFCEAVALVNQESLTAQLPADTVFEQLSVDIQLVDGVAQLDPFQAKVANINLRGTGSLNLNNEKLRADFAARLSEELEALDPACRVNERLTAIDWPLECKGELSGDPAQWCAIETGEIIENLAKNEARRQVKKEAGKFFKNLLDRD